MFFVLSKIAYFFISPFTWLLVGLGLFIFGRSKKWRKIGKISSIVIVLFFSNTFILKEFIRLWEVPAVKSSTIDHHEVAIVLGGMFEYDNSTERLSVRRGADRIWQALDLYHANKVDKILISGDNGFVFSRNLHESKQLKELLVQWNIPKEDLIIETTSRNTYENARDTKKILAQSYPHLTSFILITSATHMRRAKACFDKQKVSCTVFSTDQYTGGERNYHWDEFIIPNVFNFHIWFELLKEWVGYISYFFMGYL